MIINFENKNTYKIFDLHNVPFGDFVHSFEVVVALWCEPNFPKFHRRLQRNPWFQGGHCADRSVHYHYCHC